MIRQSIPMLTFALALLGAQETNAPLIAERFQPGWEKEWMVRRVTGSKSRHAIEGSSEDAVLRIESERSATALWRMLNVHPVDSGRIAWRWRIASSLSGEMPEREREGDDYAARVFVAFDPDLFDLSSRALCYVWAHKEEVGSTYPSPYSNNIRMIVVESGNDRAGEWAEEGRDIVADYELAFGERPQMITALALMVDTDNTGSAATAWFDDIVLDVR